MIVSWNIRGLNKAGKVREISSRLQKLAPAISVLIETRVKEKNAICIRRKLRLEGNYIDNYSHHDNGRIWIHWDEKKRNMALVESTDQLIHCKINDVNGNFLFWLTAIYAHNQLQCRKELCQDIERINAQQNGPWILVGDYNNVMKTEDRIGGNDVTEQEYIDLTEMMSNTCLYEKDSGGDYFTWSNKQGDNAIYSRIDHVLCNVEWMQQNGNTTLTNMNPSISGHAMIVLHDSIKAQRPKKQFRFINCCAEMDNFQEIVKNNWDMPLVGNPMFAVWKKLQRLQPHIRKLSKPLAEIHKEIARARNDLNKAHDTLMTDRLDSGKIHMVKKCSDNIIRLQEMDDSMVRQRAKIDWLRLSDGNNKYFHASIMM
ncbi:unnamed protein product [Lathyrus sativus]|nr:unnamed protein product [Lathyrus sativus]